MHSFDVQRNSNKKTDEKQKKQTRFSYAPPGVAKDAQVGSSGCAGVDQGTVDVRLRCG